jgi:hypothetical protein
MALRNDWGVVGCDILAAMANYGNHYAETQAPKQEACAETS